MMACPGDGVRWLYRQIRLITPCFPHTERAQRRHARARAHPAALRTMAPRHTGMLSIAASTLSIAPPKGLFFLLY